jgi:outer membrane protein TolC
LAESELSNILSADKNELINQQVEQSSVKTKQLQKSWINPIMLQYSKNYTTQFGDTVDTQQFVISVDQPIFKMGGIWSAIKYAKALGKANDLDIELQRRQAISQALTILYNLKKSKYQLEKLDLMVANDKLDVQIQKESYEEGLTNRTLYDQALLKHNKDITAKLDIDLSVAELENKFALLSDDDPYKIKTPTFAMIDEKRYNENQLELERDTLRIEEKNQYKKMTWAKYLPEVSLTGRYVNEDLNPMFAQPGSSLNREYFNYGFRVSIPLNINMTKDIQLSKIDHMNAQVKRDEKRKEIANRFKLIKERLKIIDKKIALSQEDANHYANMYAVALDLEQAGDSTSYDTEIITNTLEVRKIDQDIYKYDAQVELLGLYTRVVDAR